MKRVPNLNLLINSSMLPWNIYGDLESPNPKVPLNVMALGKEWYNSFMPPFFDFSDLDLILSIKNRIDSGYSFNTILESEDLGKEYLSYLDSLFSSDCRSKTIKNLSERVSFYFNNLEPMLVRLEPDEKEDSYLIKMLSFLYVSINMMQLFMDPVEAFTVGKDFCSINIRNKVFGDEKKILSLLEKSIPIELVFIPLAVAKDKNYLFSEYEEVFNYTCAAMKCTSEELDYGLQFAESMYKYTEYFSLDDASSILRKVDKKIEALELASEEELLINEIQLLNGCMTWSKYIPLQQEPLRFRYYTTNSILDKVLLSESLFALGYIATGDLETTTISGAEKQGKIICLLNTIFSKDKALKNKILKEALSVLENLNMYLC